LLCKVRLFALAPLGFSSQFRGALKVRLPIAWVLSCDSWVWACASRVVWSTNRVGVAIAIVLARILRTFFIGDYVRLIVLANIMQA
jgi:hypothetical protein